MSECQPIETAPKDGTLSTLDQRIDAAMEAIEAERHTDGSSDEWWRDLVSRIINASDQSA